MQYDRENLGPFFYGVLNDLAKSTIAAVRWGADQRKELEHLCRYITRPAIANERLKRNRAGDVGLRGQVLNLDILSLTVL